MKRFPQYRDIDMIFSTVMARGEFPARYRTASEGAAINWRLRANRYRAEMRKYDKLARGAPFGECPYDELYLTIEGSTVIIDLKKPEGILEIGGKVVTPELAESEDDEEDFSLE